MEKRIKFISFDALIDIRISITPLLITGGQSVSGSTRSFTHRPPARPPEKVSWCPKKDRYKKLTYRPFQTMPLGSLGQPL